MNDNKNGSKDLISIIIPVYNVVEFLEKCVESAINQTYSNLEIILVDDGSTDGSAILCDELATRDNRIKVIHKKNGGLSSARNVGLDSSTGEFIGFLDSDDFIEPDMYEMMYRELADNQEAGACSSMLYKYEDGTVGIYRKEWDVKYRRIITGNDFAAMYLSTKRNFVICSKLFRSCLIKGTHFREGRINEDILFLFDLSPKIENKKVTTIEIPYRGYYYRQHTNSICNNIVKPLEISTLYNYSEIITYYHERGNKRMERLCYSFYYHILFVLLFKILHNENWKKEYLKDYSTEIKQISFSSIICSASWKDILKFCYLKYLRKI